MWTQSFILCYEDRFFFGWHSYILLWIAIVYIHIISNFFVVVVGLGVVLLHNFTGRYLFDHQFEFYWFYSFVWSEYWFSQNGNAFQPTITLKCLCATNELCYKSYKKKVFPRIACCIATILYNCHSCKFCLFGFSLKCHVPQFTKWNLNKNTHTHNVKSLDGANKCMDGKFSNG